MRVNYPGAFDKLLNKWWDDYKGEDVVFIEELQPTHIKLVSHLKRWADHYPFRAEVKYGTVVIRPKKIIVTSNYRIRELFPDPHDYEPLERRFVERYFGEGGADFETMVSEGPRLPQSMVEGDEVTGGPVDEEPGVDVLLDLLMQEPEKPVVKAGTGGEPIVIGVPAVPVLPMDLTGREGVRMEIKDGEKIPRGLPDNTCIVLKRKGRPVIELHGKPEFSRILNPKYLEAAPPRVKKQKGAVAAIVVPLPAPEGVADAFLRPVTATVVAE